MTLTFCSAANARMEGSSALSSRSPDRMRARICCTSCCCSVSVEWSLRMRITADLELNIACSEYIHYVQMAASQKCSRRQQAPTVYKLPGGFIGSRVNDSGSQLFARPYGRGDGKGGGDQVE